MGWVFGENRYNYCLFSIFIFTTTPPLKRYGGYKAGRIIIPRFIYCNIVIFFQSSLYLY